MDVEFFDSLEEVRKYLAEAKKPPMPGNLSGKQPSCQESIS